MFKRLRLNPNEFYLLILPQGSKWALMKNYVKPLGATKTQGFHQNLQRYNLFLHP